MENSGGEPDVVELRDNKLVYCDCAPESPKGRRSLCYDSQALKSRKKNKPDDSDLNLAATMGIEVRTEEEYRNLQSVGEFERIRPASPRGKWILGVILSFSQPKRYGHLSYGRRKTHLPTGVN